MTLVDDGVADNAFTQDIDRQLPNNYTYDAIGNLIKDNAEEIQNITWNVYGKMTSIDNIMRPKNWTEL